ncbi:hypothetical protein JL49_13190 [Pseudoalteromonas luteoviolacea]|nr:hypothetical protein JL49_13190 [Pseudoalteromonas luteoviolacea]
MRIPWTQAEDEALIKYVSQGLSARDIKLSGRTTSAIQSRINTLGIAKNRRAWSDEELQTVKDFYPYMSAKDVQQKYLPNRSPLSIKQQAGKLGVVNLVRNNLTGKRYGQLVVESYAGHKEYGGRSQSAWLCYCDCGEQIVLEYDKLPTTSLMEKSGRLLYTSCEKCREKTCPVCGDKFPYSHTSHICPKPECQITLEKERDNFWHAVHRFKMQNDDEYRLENNAKARESYAKNSHIWKENSRIRFEALPKNEQERIIQERRDKAKARMDEIRNDPQKHAHYKQVLAAWKNKQALANMFADAAALQELIEKE